MSVMVAELYEALRKAGVDEPLAREAARSVLSADARTDLATKADIADVRTAIAESKADLIKWNVGTLIALAAIVSTIVKLL